MLFSQHRKRPSEEVDRMERERAGLPAHITRHGFVARVFHWVMAFSMLALLFTGVPADRRACGSRGCSGTGWPASC